MTSGKKRINEVLSSTPRRALALFAAVGTITGAVAGVIALLPKPAPTPDSLSASFSDVRAYPNMSLEQYDARARPGIVGTAHTASTGVISYELAADTSASTNGSAAEGGEARGSTGSSSGETSEGEAGAGQSGSTGTEGTTSTSKTPTGPAEGKGKEGEGKGKEEKEGSGEHEPAEEEGARPGGKIQLKSPEVPYPEEQKLSPQDLAVQKPQSLHSTEGATVSNGPGTADEQQLEELTLTVAGEPGDEQAGTTALAPNVMSHCAKHGACGAQQELETALTYDPDPAKAAKAVLALFNNSRSEIVEKRLYPIGAMVTYNVSLAGFAHQSTTLEWSLISQESKRPLPRPWWRNIVVARIKPAVNNESLYGTFWVPVPPQHGNYLVHLVLLDSHGVPHAASDSAPVFH